VHNLPDKCVGVWYMQPCPVGLAWIHGFWNVLRHVRKVRCCFKLLFNLQLR